MPAAPDPRWMRDAWEEVEEGLVRFLRDLLRCESPPGDEEAAAQRAAEEMRAVGLGGVRIDAWGNVLGEAGPEEAAGRVLLNAHLDVVSAGDPSAWSHPPFGGDLVGGTIYGRGACDTKSAVAAQVHAAGLLAREGLLRSRLGVAAVVMEEVGGIGTLGLLEEGEAPDYALVGEPCDGCLMVGHRGRVQIEVDFVGKAHHAAVAGAGRSPHGSLAAFLQSVRSIDLPTDELYGAASLEPTIVRSDNASPNVVPERVHVVLDCRTLPDQDAAALEREVADRAREACEEGIGCEARVPVVSWRTWTDKVRELPHVMPSFGTDPDDPAVAACRRLLAEVAGEEPPIRPWRFATDGGHLTRAGATVVGWGPGSQARAHTADEYLTLEELRRGFEGTLACAMALDALASERG